MTTQRRESFPEFIQAGLYFYCDSGYATRGLRAKTGESGLLRPGFCDRLRRFLCAGRLLAVANTSPDALVVVPGRWIISFRWDSETGLAASFEQVLDKAWLAYGTHRQPGDHGGVVLRSGYSHCSFLPNIGKRSVAPIT